MISRRRVVQAGAMGAALVLSPLARVRRAFAQSVPSFDYFISAKGDDSNPGTLSSPWSITALNSKMSLYGGKAIGLIGDQGAIQVGRIAGVETSLYALYQAQPGNNAGSVLMINGGPSGSQPTYVASCDSSGTYTPRLAVVDAADPVTGAQPTVQAAFMGQSTYLATIAPPQFGNITIDGIVVRNFTWAGLVFDGNAANPVNNLIVKNCEIYNLQNVISNNNPGAIWLDFANEAVITNCMIHDLRSNASGTVSNMQACGVITFNSYGTNITNCTFYNGCSISAKDGWQQMNVSYCYCGWGPFGQPYSAETQYSNMGGTIHNYLCGSGVTVAFHHNIVIGPLLAYGESGQANEGTVLIYNNTFYKPGGIGGADRGLTAFTDLYPANGSGGGGVFEFYNNLIYAEDGRYEGIQNSANPACFVKMDAPTGGGQWSALRNTDYNAYGAGMTFGYGWSNGQYALPLSTWRSYGYDAHSILLNSSPFVGTPAEPDASSFAITGPATTAGMNGAVCGANDGTGLIGCDFASSAVPAAPILKVG